MCDTLVAAAGQTAGGVALFAKNSDRKAGECQPFIQLPAASHAAGSRVRCTYLEIPQVAETYRFMGHSPWWVWGLEHGVNEHGVAIGNLSVFSNEPLEEELGLIGMDLVRLGLERGRTAREALEIIAGLVECHGQGGPALEPHGAGYHNAFQLADPDEAWTLQTSNRRWAARRVDLDACSNHLSLGSDWEIGSRDLESFARGEGWWERQGRIDVAAAYRNAHVPGRISEGRLRRSRELLAAARGKLDVATLAEILRDHGPGRTSWVPGPTSDDEAYFTLCAHSDPVSWTTASLIAELPRERSALWSVWISFATPCTSIFLPVYLAGVIPAAYAQGSASEEAGSAWWCFERLQDAVLADPVRHTPGVRAAWDAFAVGLEARRREAEERARAARHEDVAAEILTAFMAETADRALEEAERLRACIA